MAGSDELPLPEYGPTALTETSVLEPLTKSCTNTSRQPLVSVLTRPSAELKNATYCPLELIEDPARPLELRGVTEGNVGAGADIISVVFAPKSRRKASNL